MSELSVSERRIKPIHDAIDGENWKQALQICEKWQKKGEKSDQFQAIKAFVLVKQQDAAARQRGINETVSLCHRTPPITDLAALHQIQDSLKDLSLSADEGTQLWDRAVAAKPDDKELATTWLNRSIAENNWQGAQKAAMALRKGFPKERNHDFWNIVMCYLIHKDTSTPEKESALFGTLAYRLICKAAETVPIDKDQLLSSGKAIQTAEELYLLVKIYIGTGHAREAVELLQSDKFGHKSRFEEQDPQLMSALLLEALEAAEAWQDAFKYCKDRLQQHDKRPVSMQDDGQVWTLLVRAAKASDDSQLVQDGKAFVMSFLQKQGSLRAAQQALLGMIQILEPHSGPDGELLRSCEDYWHKFRSKAYCFEDIKSVLSELDQPKQERFLDTLSSRSSKEEEGGTKDASESNNAALNLLKLRYCFSLPVGVSPEQLHKFVCDSLEVYSTSLDGSSPCPEAALLSAMALVRLAFAGLAKSKSAERSDQDLLQAVFLLESCRSRTKDYYPYSLLLLQIKSLLGLMSLAMTDFRSLNVKNVQWETTGHLLLTRISTSHPRSAGTATPSEEAGTEPLRALAAALVMSENAGESLSAQIGSGLKNGSYVTVIESVDMRSDLEYSLNRHVFIQEEARIKQLLSTPDAEEIPLRPSHLIDNRDFSYLPSYEADGSPAFGHYLRSGPLPGERWLAAITLYNQTVRFLRGELYGHRAPSTNEIELFQTALAASSNADTKELTDVELDNFTAHTVLASAAVALKRPSGPDDAGLDKHISELENWLRAKVGLSEETSKTDDAVKSPRYTLDFGSDIHIKAPSWTYLHRAFSLLETLQGVALLLAVLSPQPKAKSAKAKAKPGRISADTISAMQELVQEIETGIHQSARELKRDLNVSGMLGRLMDIGLGRDEKQDELSALGKMLEGLSDVTSLEVLCGDIRESWEEALDGILAVKVKTK